MPQNSGSKNSPTVKQLLEMEENERKKKRNGQIKSIHNLQDAMAKFHKKARICIRSIEDLKEN